MELRVLNYFLAIAREENITRAAQMLHVTQPTLSRQIMQLEEELGVKLFVRSNHNIILTEAGMLLKQQGAGTGRPGGQGRKGTSGTRREELARARSPSAAGNSSAPASFPA